MADRATIYPALAGWSQAGLIAGAWSVVSRTAAAVVGATSSTMGPAGRGRMGGGMGIVDFSSLFPPYPPSPPFPPSLPLLLFLCHYLSPGEFAATFSAVLGLGCHVRDFSRA